MPVTDRDRRAWRLALWGLVIVALLQGWLVGALADRLQETRANLESAEKKLHQARVNFERCKGANRGLVEGLHEQQALINDALRLAQRCERPTYFAYLPD